MTIPEAFQLAMQHHQAGRLGEAEGLYRQILGVQPQHADALHLLGVIAHQVGRYEMAVELIGKAVELAPGAAVCFSNLGEAYRMMGRRNEAIAAYGRALQLKPDYAEVHSRLGNVLREAGRKEEAVASCVRAVELCPGLAEGYVNLGNALREIGRLEEAIRVQRRAIELQPGLVEAHNNLGNALLDHGEKEAAIAAYRRALELSPRYAVAQNNLGNALKGSGRIEEAIDAYRQAILLEPAHAALHYNLGSVLSEAGRAEEAMAAYERALELRPDYAAAHNNMGNVLAVRGRHDEAIGAYRRAVRCQPDYAVAWANLGNVCKDGGRLEEAVAAYREAIRLSPEEDQNHNSLGHALKAKGCMEEAIEAYGRALGLRPDSAETHNNIGAVLCDQGRLEEAIAIYERAVRIQPDDPALHSTLILTSLYQQRDEDTRLAAEYRRWDERHGLPMRRFIVPHRNSIDPGRRLRIGYVSPDFRHHVICHFLTPLLENDNHAEFEIFCYSSVSHPDAITDRLMKCADAWRDVLDLSDEAVAELIREDRIDILVDLSLHTSKNRLSVFARKPAPVQVAWLGHPGTTGLSAMDYRLTDAFMEPEGSAWSESVERPVRLPDSWFCFDPIDTYPEPEELPALKAGFVTFGSLNHFCKVTGAVLEVWAEILHAVEGSRLLLQCPAGATQARVRQWFAGQGIPPERLELVSRTATREEFLRLFGRIDVALDPFPCTGGTSTCEALWMGLPVVTLKGTMARARQTFSVLSSVGLAEFAADSKAQYVQIVRDLAKDRRHLASLRMTLREKMKSSVFMDAPRFARSVERAYRQMWRSWCEEQNPPSKP